MTENGIILQISPRHNYEQVRNSSLDSCSPHPHERRARRAGDRPEKWNAGDQWRCEKPGIILERFIALAGGPDAPIIVIPTSGNAEEYDQNYSGLKRFRDAGARNLFVLHTRNRAVANSDEFVKPLQSAKGVWFEGGSHWRHADAYLDTKVHKELLALLDRGGVIGGGSAGAHIQSDYMEVSRSPQQEFGERKIPQSEWRRGLALVKNVAIDVHVLARNRQFDLIGVIQSHLEMLGIGIDEDTAIVVQDDKFEVIGRSFALIYDNQRQLDHDGAETFRTAARFNEWRRRVGREDE